jgi:hypothetical protein
MTISDRLSPDEVEIRVQKRIAELEKANQALSRSNLILERINKIFNVAVQEKTKEDMGNECLSVALEVTGSRIGFVSLIGDDGLLHDIAIRDMGWAQCLMYDKTGHRRPPENFVVHGLYDSVINNEKSFFTNDPLSHPYSIGVPHDHPLLKSFLGVPLVLDEKIMGILGVANREGGYSSESRRISKLSRQRLWKLFRKKSRTRIFARCMRDFNCKARSCRLNLMNF